MPDLAEICANCKAEHEKEIQEWRHNQDMCFKSAEESDKRIRDLQAENEQLKKSCQEWMAARPVTLEVKHSESITKLLDLLEPDIIGREKIINHDPRIIEIIEVYRAIRPRKGG